MTVHVSGQYFRGKRLPPGSVTSDVSIDNCTFENCMIGAREGSTRSEIHDLVIKDSVGKAVYVYDATIRRCGVDGYHAKGPKTLFRGCFFERVVLKNVQGRIFIEPRDFPHTSGSVEKDFYASIDTFALDLRETTGSLELRWIPPEVVWCDASRQGFIKVDTALRVQEAIDGPFFKQLLGAGEFKKEHTFVSLPARGKKSQEARAHLQRLGELGLLARTYRADGPAGEPYR